MRELQMIVGMKHCRTLWDFYSLNDGTRTSKALEAVEANAASRPRGHAYIIMYFLKAHDPHTDMDIGHWTKWTWTWTFLEHLVLFNVSLLLEKIAAHEFRG